MKKKIYDERSFNLDTSVQSVYRYILKNFDNREDSDCICFYQEPRYSTQYSFVPSLVLVDREYGVLVFKAYDYKNGDISYMGEDSWVVNGNRIPNQAEYLEDYFYEFKSDVFRPINKLKERDIPFKQFIIFPFLDESSLKETDEYIKDMIDDGMILFRDYEVNLNIQSTNKPLDDNKWKNLQSIIQKVTGLSRSMGIKIKEPISNLRDAITMNENKIYLLDDDQLDAAMTLSDGCQRIRGLAGTGKTIVLSMKAARLHALYPDAKILYTFYTQSLYKQITRLVSIFYKKMTGEEFDTNNQNLKIMHSWGGKVKKGVYSDCCKKVNIRPKTYNDVRFDKNPFGTICKELLEYELKEEYDYVLIDEAQDLPVEFFHLVARIAKKPCNIVWAYDELQSTGDVQMPEAKELFGLDYKGDELVVLNNKNDFILEKSYRNNIKVLFLAIGLGFGIYSENGIVQMINEEETWRALGFELESNSLKYGEDVEIKRPEKNSPMNIQSYYNKYDVLTSKFFETRKEELDYVSDNIIKLINEENVKPEDIIVIDLDQKKANDNLKYIQRLLFEADINSTIPGFVDSVDDFFIEENVTLTTARRAKGNESPVVFILGIDTMYQSKNKVEDRIKRNLAFISITRAKGWCFITGSGKNCDLFKVEYDKIFKHFPVFKFKYPEEEYLKEIQRITYITTDSELYKTTMENKDMMLNMLDQDPEMLKALLREEELEKIKNYLSKLSR